MEMLAEMNMFDNLWSAIGWLGAVSGWTVVAVFYVINAKLRKQISDAVRDAKNTGQ